MENTIVTLVYKAGPIHTQANLMAADDEASLLKAFLPEQLLDAHTDTLCGRPSLDYHGYTE